MQWLGPYYNICLQWLDACNIAAPNPAQNIPQTKKPNANILSDSNN
jgi:hypothetical protein